MSCIQCGEPASLQCTGCNLGVLYCGADCSKEDWPRHREYCTQGIDDPKNLKVETEAVLNLGDNRSVETEAGLNLGDNRSVETPITSLDGDNLYSIYSNDTDFITGFAPRPESLYGRFEDIEQTILHHLVPVEGVGYGLIQRRLHPGEDGREILPTEHLETRDWKTFLGWQPSVVNGPNLLTSLFPSNRFQIAVTSINDDAVGPPILMHHGVPANRLQQLEVGKRLALLGYRVILLDFLGMGQSDKPLFYGSEIAALEALKDGILDTMDLDGRYQEYYKWQYDVTISEQVMQTLAPGQPFYYAADDWGAGPQFHYAAKYGSRRLLGLITWDPIALDGYPVHEIQAIGRAASGPGQAARMMAGLLGKEGDKTLVTNLHQLFFSMGMSAADQTMTQIYKTMVHNPDKVYNQYSLRVLALPYASAHYVNTLDGQKSTSASMQLKLHNLWVLAQRASVLGSGLLLPYDARLNPDGVRYRKIDVPCLIMWGAQDNMMPETQRWRLAQMIAGPTCHMRVENAGHFAAVDQPDQVAENIVMWFKMNDAYMNQNQWAQLYPKPCFGFTGIWKSDEKRVYEKLLEIKRADDETF